MHKAQRRIDKSRAALQGAGWRLGSVLPDEGATRSLPSTRAVIIDFVLLKAGRGASSSRAPSLASSDIFDLIQVDRTRLTFVSATTRTLTRSSPSKHFAGQQEPRQGQMISMMPCSFNRP